VLKYVGEFIDVVDPLMNVGLYVFFSTDEVICHESN